LGKGARAWLMDEGIRLYVTAEQGKMLTEVFKLNEIEDGTPFVLFPNQFPNTIKVEWTKPHGGKTWHGPRTSPAAPQEVAGFELEAQCMDDLINMLDEALERFGRITVPTKGQTLASQPSAQQDPWPTLHRALNISLPEDITWEQLVDEFVDRCGINRYDEVPKSGDARIIEAWSCPALPAPLAVAAAATAGGEGSAATAGGGGSADDGREESPRATKTGRSDTGGPAPMMDEAAEAAAVATAAAAVEEQKLRKVQAAQVAKLNKRFAAQMEKVDVLHLETFQGACVLEMEQLKQRHVEELAGLVSGDSPMGGQTGA
jgi:hypothetical protein